MYNSLFTVHLFVKLPQVEGLAKHLRCVGMDAAIPYSKKPETRYKRANSFIYTRVNVTIHKHRRIFVLLDVSFIFFRELIYQAQKEKRVLLTRDAKLLRHEYLIKNQIYRIRSLLKNDQLLEVKLTYDHLLILFKTYIH